MCVVFNRSLIEGAAFKPGELAGKSLKFYDMTDDYLFIVYAEDADGVRYLFSVEIINERAP